MQPHPSGLCNIRVPYLLLQCIFPTKRKIHDIYIFQILLCFPLVAPMQNLMKTYLGIHHCSFFCGKMCACFDPRLFATTFLMRLTTRDKLCYMEMKSFFFLFFFKQMCSSKPLNTIWCKNIKYKKVTKNIKNITVNGDKT